MKRLGSPHIPSGQMRPALHEKSFAAAAGNHAFRSRPQNARDDSASIMRSANRLRFVLFMPHSSR
jgi:hypothetical protein